MRKNFGVKSWFYPLPVLIIGTYDEEEKADAMNAAWGGLYDADKSGALLQIVGVLRVTLKTDFCSKNGGSVSAGSF